MMAEPIEDQYRELLNPIRDPAGSFSVNIAQLLQNYLTSLIEGSLPPNFNSAALLLQGSACIYSKKVEYLYNLATQLHHNLQKQRNEDNEEQPRKENKRKEKQKDTSVFHLQSNLKYGKNISQLSRKEQLKNANKKALKKNNKKQKFVLINLLPLDDGNKGFVFHDVNGEEVGNTGDFYLNTSTLNSSGWVLLPTLNSFLIPSTSASSDYDDEECGFYANDCNEDQNEHSPGNEVGAPDSSKNNTLPLTPSDEGIGMDCKSAEYSSPGDALSQPTSTDEGIGSGENTQNISPEFNSPSDVCSQPENEMQVEQGCSPTEPVMGNAPPEGIENVPMDTTCNPDDPAPMPIRRSIRQALRLCQLEPEESGNITCTTVEEILAVKKAIQKRNTCILPSKLRVTDENNTLRPASEFCARTFFSLDNSVLKHGMLNFEIPAFEKNSKFYNKLKNRLEELKSANRKHKKSVVTEDEEVDVEEMEVLQESDSAENKLNTPFEDGDIVVENDPEVPLAELDQDAPMANLAPEFADDGTDGDGACPMVEDPEPDVPVPNFQDLAKEQLAHVAQDIQQYLISSDIYERVADWERCVKPFLDDLDKRESFDINLYGSRILNAFGDNNRKQTISFRDFCKDKKKWEIHRYFMALLPLANIGNVLIETEPTEDGSENIVVTLLSRKMHHKDLEAFGHNDGSHS